jgi:hypothetical protein
MKLYMVCGLILSTFYGCSFIVGGDCNYQNTEGVALIKNKIQNRCTAKFAPKQVSYDIEFTCSDDIKVGKSYPAILQKATHGSCKPTILNITKGIK